MGTAHKVAKGHAAGKNGQELGLANELALLQCIKTEGWVREHEASLITGMSRYTIGMVGRRLEQKGDIFREQSKNLSYAKKKVAAKRKVTAKKTVDAEKKTTKSVKPPKRERLEGNAGYFLRLTASGADRVDGKSGKDIKIPNRWRHHAMSIQTLHFLAQNFGCTFETEASMHRRIDKKGKFPDGKLLAENQRYFFEQENSRKSGPALRKQTETIVTLAKNGFICILAYPYPASICGRVGHETRLTSSIKRLSGSPAADNIKLVRCHFDSLTAYHNMHVSQFNIIDLPVLIAALESNKGQSGEIDPTKGFMWIVSNSQEVDRRQAIEKKLYFNGEFHATCSFREGATADDLPHSIDTDNGCSFEESADEIDFGDFVLDMQRKVEEIIEAKMRLAKQDQLAVDPFANFDLE